MKFLAAYWKVKPRHIFSYTCAHCAHRMWSGISKLIFSFEDIFFRRSFEKDNTFIRNSRKYNDSDRNIRNEGRRQIKTVRNRVSTYVRTWVGVIHCAFLFDVCVSAMPRAYIVFVLSWAHRKTANKHGIEAPSNKEKRENEKDKEPTKELKIIMRIVFNVANVFSTKLAFLFSIFPFFLSLSLISFVATVLRTGMSLLEEYMAFFCFIDSQRKTFSMLLLFRIAYVCIFVGEQ